MMGNSYFGEGIESLVLTPISFHTKNFMIKKMLKQGSEIPEMFGKFHSCV
jgi:hypothetical protein